MYERTLLTVIALAAAFILAFTTNITAFADTDIEQGQSASDTAKSISETYDLPIPDYFGDDKYDTKGNLSLIKKEQIIYDSEEMQFIAVTTKDGHVFYILIDYTAVKAAENGEEDADARQTVYFLNKVDDYDLFTLLYDDSDNDGSNPYYNMLNNNNTNTDDESIFESQPDSEAEEKSSSGGLPMWAVMLVVVALAGVGYWFIKIRPNGGGKKESIDDDDDFDFDDDEINVDNETGNDEIE